MPSHRIFWIFILIIFSVIAISPTTGCTIFTVSSPDGNQVFFGSNKDHRFKYRNTTAIWFKPGDEEKFGVGYTGWYIPDYEWDGCTWDKLPMGGINSEGLCFDMNGVPESEVYFNESKPSWPSKCYTVYALEHCQTVDEVIELYKAYKFPDISPTALQLHYADASGDAVVISTGTDGSFAFTRKCNNSFLVSSNFNVINPDAGGYPCDRYSTSVSMLQVIEDSGNFTAEALSEILDAVHQEDNQIDEVSPIHTLYTTIYDLKNRDIYLYYLHDFDHVIKLNLETELTKGANYYLIIDLSKITSTTTTDTLTTITDNLTTTTDNLATTTDTLTTTTSSTNLPLEIALYSGLCFVFWLAIKRVRKKY